MWFVLWLFKCDIFYYLTIISLVTLVTLVSYSSNRLLYPHVLCSLCDFNYNLTKISLVTLVSHSSNRLLYSGVICNLCDVCYKLTIISLVTLMTLVSHSSKRSLQLVLIVWLDFVLIHCKHIIARIATLYASMLFWTSHIMRICKMLVKKDLSRKGSWADWA